MHTDDLLLLCVCLCIICLFEYTHYVFIFGWSWCWGYLPRGGRSGCLVEHLEDSIDDWSSAPCLEQILLGGKTEAWHFIIMVCPPQERFVHSLYCQCEVLWALQKKHGGLAAGECLGPLWPLSSERQRDSLGFPVTQSCLWFWEMEGILPLIWGIWFKQQLERRREQIYSFSYGAPLFIHIEGSASVANWMVELLV